MRLYSSNKHYRIVTLKQLIKNLFKKYKLNAGVHFDVWICGCYPDGKEDRIDKDNPWACCHFYGFNNTKIDSTDVFQWLEFDVEDYEFEIANEYWLCVKLCDIDADFRRC